MSQNSVYQLKVTLGGIRTPIWRRFQVYSDITFAELHQTIQIVMGWMDSHLFEFQANHIRIGDPGMLYQLEVDGLPVETTRLDECVRQEGSKFEYIYDFGDHWEHKIVLEKVLPVESGVVYPRCIAGKRACPPEDCGGQWGYANLLEALQNPQDPEHESYLEWVGGHFDPDAFDIDDVNRQLKEGVFWHGELVIAPLVSTQEFTAPARRFWEAIPPQFQTKILEGVVCMHCREMTTIVNFHGRIERGDLILQGRCITCGGEVARLVEGG